MHQDDYWDKVTRNPKRYLALYWAAWKLVFFVLALASPGIGYDTSTDVLLAAQINRQSFHRDSDRFRYGLQKFIRWDAIYFIKIAQRGHFFEQEWAFGWGFTRLLHLGARGRSRSSNLVPSLTDKVSLIFSMVLLVSARPHSAFWSLTSRTYCLS